MSIAYTMIIITLLITGLVAALTLWIRYKKMSKLAKIITIFFSRDRCDRFVNRYCSSNFLRNLSSSGFHFGYMNPK